MSTITHSLLFWNVSSLQHARIKAVRTIETHIEVFHSSEKPSKELLIMFECPNMALLTNEEIKAQEYIERGEIDRAIAIYQQLEPPSARVFLLIGMLYANNKGNFELAVSYYEQALHMQEKVCRSNTLADQ